MHSMRGRLRFQLRQVLDSWMPTRYRHDWGPSADGGRWCWCPAIPMRGDGPNMPNYAWPSCVLTTPFPVSNSVFTCSMAIYRTIYPYPQVPWLGRVSLEWDDGWWYADFDERHVPASPISGIYRSFGSSHRSSVTLLSALPNGLPGYLPGQALSNHLSLN